MIEKKASSKGNTVRVKFELPGEAASESVAVAGDFNGWSEDEHQMKYVKSRDVWSTTLTLPADSTHQFRYRIDGKEWRNDEDADEVAESPYGSQNSVLKL